MRAELLKSWGILVGLQALVGAILFHDFLVGNHYFAWLDIGLDTYAQFAPFSMLMARELAQDGWTGWSFQIGLGAPTALMMADMFGLLTQLGGAERVLELRIWVYFLKLTLGGAFFLLLVRPWVQRRSGAILGALAYTFCGYAVVNGQWDGEANAFVFFPLLLWGISRCVRSGGNFALPICVCVTLISGVVFVTVVASLLVACAAFVALSADARAMVKTLLLRVLPRAGLGFLLAAPYVLPAALQLIDSPRVGGPESLFRAAVAQALSFSDAAMILVQVGGLFHKDIFGAGNLHAGYMNYLEGPEFYIGMLPLLVIAQLWNGTTEDRRMLLACLCAVAVYFLFPFFRLAAFGFAAPYFRSSSMWLTLALMLLATRGLDWVFTFGVNKKLLAAGCVVMAALLGIVVWCGGESVSAAHAGKMAVLLAAGAGVLVYAVADAPPSVFPVAALMLCEIVAVAWPSYFGNRLVAAPQLHRLKDVTDDALRVIRRQDQSVFRVEKTFDSASFADAMAQGYMGIKSYYYHGRGIVDFYSGMDLLPANVGGRPVNFTNYLPSPGPRYVLYSMLGVKYLISRVPVAWPGFDAMHSGRGYFIYRNRFAAPLGVVQSRQVTKGAVARLDTPHKDLVLMSAVVLEEFWPQWGAPFEPAALARDLEQTMPALQRSGLEISRFSNGRVTGRIHPEQAGILVFSIPAYPGWSLRIDGEPAPLHTANFGMLAAPVKAGIHEIELEYRSPGRREGLVLALAGLLILAGLGVPTRVRL